MNTPLGALRSFLASQPPLSPARPNRAGTIEKAGAPLAPRAKFEGGAEKRALIQWRPTCSTCPTEKPRAREQNADTALSAVTAWRAAIAGAPAGRPDFVILKEVSLRFLDSPDAVTAVMNGWDAMALFAIHAGDAPKMRVDCWGLVLFLAWGAHAYTVDMVDQKVCAIRTRSGAVLRQPRRRANCTEAILWWLHPRLTQESEGEL